MEYETKKSVVETAAMQTEGKPQVSNSPRHPSSSNIYIGLSINTFGSHNKVTSYMLKNLRDKTATRFP